MMGIAMGMKIVRWTNGVTPTSTILVLTCDGPACTSSNSDDSKPFEQQFSGASFIEGYSLAIQVGWKESRAGTFLCPACSNEG